MPKRKASVFEEPHANADWPTFDYSSSASTASPESVKATADLDHTQQYWNVGTIPYLNSRTRKRHRDGRPDEEIVHQNTLAKLFNAQRHIHMEENKAPWGINDTVMPNLQGTIPTITVWEAPTSSLGAPERNQKSIHSFFGGGSRNANTLPQPSEYQFSTMQKFSPAVSTCEDCNSVLEDVNVNGDAMLMDGLPQDEWACASCTRRVCDTCAVRGHDRICLECAMPGGGG